MADLAKNEGRLIGNLIMKYQKENAEKNTFHKNIR